MNSIRITIYRWAGRKWFFRARARCVECDLTEAQVRHLLSAHPDWPVEIEIKPWLNHLWECLRHWGWHPPVVLVEGKRIRQGTIPTRAELEAAVKLALQKHASPGSLRPAQSPGG